MRERLTTALYVLAFCTGMFGLPVGGCLYYFSRMNRLQSEGLEAEGVVVGGETGSTIDSSYYCSETVQFQDSKGDKRLVGRACDDKPNTGEKVRVFFDSADPTDAYVEGDSRTFALSFWILFACLAVALAFARGALRPR